MRASLRLLIAVLALLPSLLWAATENVVLVIGDDFSAAYGMPANKGWVNLLVDRLARKRYPHAVVNASVSGETTAGGLSRLPALLRQHRPAVVVIELGSGDGTRGVALGSTRRNLAQMAAATRRSGAELILVGIDPPANLGAKYVQELRSIQSSVARVQGATLVPDALANILKDPDMMQSDRFHPNSFAQPALLETLWPALEKALSGKP